MNTESSGPTGQGQAGTAQPGAPAGNRSYALITPSYYVDVERCRLLVESTEAFLPPEVKHYIVVDQADKKLFAPLASRRTQLLIKQDILPYWLFQIPFARRYWLSLRSLPVRGWIVQQLVKLSMNLAIPEDVFIYADSALVFIKPFQPQARVRYGLEPLFREPDAPITAKSRSRLHNIIYYLRNLSSRGDWLSTAVSVLDVKGNPRLDSAYVESLVTWRRDTLHKLHEHIEAVHGRPWIEVLCRELFFSEYVLYGIFCEHILGIEQAGHYPTPLMETRSYWHEADLSDEELIRMRDSLEPHEVAVMINEKSKIPPSLIRKVFIETLRGTGK